MSKDITDFLFTDVGLLSPQLPNIFGYESPPHSPLPLKYSK